MVYEIIKKVLVINRVHRYTFIHVMIKISVICENVN